MLVERPRCRLSGTGGRGPGFRDAVGGRAADVPRSLPDCAAPPVASGRVSFAPAEDDGIEPRAVTPHPISSRGQGPSWRILHARSRLARTWRRARELNPCGCDAGLRFRIGRIPALPALQGASTVCAWIRRRAGWPRGIEPLTSGSTTRCSNQLSYGHSAPRKIRTPDARHRRPALCPLSYGGKCLP